MFAERLKSLRIHNGLSQEQLAKKIGLSQQSIGHYEVGRAQPDHETLCRIADVFDCTTDYLLGRNDNRKELSAEDIDLEDLLKNKVFFRNKLLRFY